MEEKGEVMMLIARLIDVLEREKRERLYWMFYELAAKIDDAYNVYPRRIKARLKKLESCMNGSCGCDDKDADRITQLVIEIDENVRLLANTLDYAAKRIEALVKEIPLLTRLKKRKTIKNIVMKAVRDAKSTSRMLRVGIFGPLTLIQLVAITRCLGVCMGREMSKHDGHRG